MPAITVIYLTDEAVRIRRAQKCLIECGLQWRTIDEHVSESYDGITSWAEILLLRTAYMLQCMASKVLQATLALAYASAVLMEVVKRRQMAHVK